MKCCSTLVPHTLHWTRRSGSELPVAPLVSSECKSLKLRCKRNVWLVSCGKATQITRSMLRKGQAFPESRSPIVFVVTSPESTVQASCSINLLKSQ